MTILGRRKYERFPLAQPVDGNLRVRDEVAIEEWREHDMVILSPVPCRVGERVTLEIADRARRDVSGTVAQCRPSMTGDEQIRYRVKLSIERQAAAAGRAGKGKS